MPSSEHGSRKQAAARPPARAAASLLRVLFATFRVERGQHRVRGHLVVDEELSNEDEGEPRRLVLRQDRPLPVPRHRLHVRRRVHDRRAPDPRLGGERRPEPAAARAAREGGRAQPARRHLRAGFGPSASYYAWKAAGRPGPRRPREGVIEQRSALGPLSLGVEEELMILDAATSTRSARSTADRPASRAASCPGALKTELLRFGRRAEHRRLRRRREALEALGALRARPRDGGARRARDRRGGTHPFARPEEQPIVDEERYTSFVATPASRPAGRASRASTSTSGCRRPSVLAGARGCCRGCRSCSRSRRTRRGSPAR